MDANRSHCWRTTARTPSSPGSFFGVVPVRRLVLGVAILCLWSCPIGRLFAAPPAGAPIVLNVDVSDATQRIFHTQELIPVEPGPVTLYYAKWIPGTHGPTGPIADLAGLRMHVDGKDVPWRRDDVDMYAFHCTVPEGARHAGSVASTCWRPAAAVLETRPRTLPSFAGTRSWSTRRGSRSTQFPLRPRSRFRRVGR